MANMETSRQTSDADARGSGPRVCDAPENSAAKKANAKANLWERIDPSEIEWSGYGIADYDLLDADRKLLLLMAVAYTRFDDDPLFENAFERGAAQCDPSPAAALLHRAQVDKASLRGAVLRDNAPQGGWASCFREVLDRIDGRCGMILHIPCLPLSSGCNEAASYTDGMGKALWYEEDPEVLRMLSERGALLGISNEPNPGVQANETKLRAFFYLPAATRDVVFGSRRWSLGDLDFTQVSARKELLASWNADAYRWLRDNRPETVKHLSLGDVEFTDLHEAFFEGKSGKPVLYDDLRAEVVGSRSWTKAASAGLVKIMARRDFEAAEQALLSKGGEFPGGRYDVEIWVDCAKGLDKEAFDFLKVHGFDFPSAVARKHLPEKHPKKLDGCFVSDILEALRRYRRSDQYICFDALRGRWNDDVMEEMAATANYMLHALCEMGCKMPKVKNFDHDYSEVVMYWPRDTELFKKVARAGFPRRSLLVQGKSLQFALEGGGVSSAQALLDMGFKMPKTHWFRFSGNGMTYAEREQCREFAKELGWDVR